MLPLSVMADGNVTVTINQFSDTLQIFGDQDDNSLLITSGKKRSLLIKARNGTTINGFLDALEVTDYYQDVDIDLQSGEDQLDIKLVDLPQDRLNIYQDQGDCLISITKSNLWRSEIVTGIGEDVVKLSDVAAKTIRVADADGAFPLNVALPSTSSYIATADTQIECLDLQARTVDVNRHFGALLVATTFGKIENVDATSGNANLGFHSFFPIVEDAMVAIAAEYDSPASDVELYDIEATETGVLYYDTLLNDRTNSNDRILIDQVETDTFTVATGFGTDEVRIRNVHATGDTLVDLGSDSDDRNLDGRNFAWLQNVYAEDDVEIVGGSNRDEIVLQYLYTTDSLSVDTGSGPDQVWLNNTYVAYDCEVVLGSGSDKLSSYGSYLGDLTLDGGSEKDQATQSYSSWQSATVLNVEYDNF
jgi:hypothetical protein